MSSLPEPDYKEEAGVYVISLTVVPWLFNVVLHAHISLVA